MKLDFRKAGSVTLMVILGIMWTVSGWFGVTRQDPSEYLEVVLVQVLEEEDTIAFYRPFLSKIVIPNKALFAGLISWGELLVGISFLSGTLLRVSSLAGVFLLVNYGLMNGALVQHAVLIFLMVLIFLSKASRVYGFDKVMHRKRPRSGLF